MAECFDKNMIDKDEYPQTAEIEARCVKILANLWNAPTPSRRRVLDDRLERGCHARRARAQAALAEAPCGRGPVRGQAQPGDGHQRPGLLGEVRQLLGRRDAPRPDGRRSVPTHRRRGGQALRREHDRCRRHPRLDVRRLVRAGRGDLRCARRPRARDRHRRPRPRRRRLGRVRSPRSSIRISTGTSACRAWRRSTPLATSTGWSTPASAGSSGATPRRCPRTWSSGSTTSATTCRRSPSTSHGRVPRWLRSTTTSSGSASTGYREVQGYAREVATRLSGDCQDRSLRAPDRRATSCPVFAFRLQARRRELHRLRRLERAPGAGLAGAGVHVPGEPDRPRRAARGRDDAGSSHDLADLLVGDLERQLPRLQKQPTPVHDRTTASGFHH